MDFSPLQRSMTTTLQFWLSGDIIENRMKDGIIGEMIVGESFFLVLNKTSLLKKLIDFEQK
jgi:hypothetical protein